MSVPGIPLVMGYCDPWVVAPGETIAFKIGTRDGARRYRASIVRVISSDTGPAGAGLKTEDVAASVNGERDGVPRPIPVGSFALVEHPRAIAGLGAFTIQALVQATLPGQGPQAIVSSWTEGARDSAFTLLLDEDGAAAIQFGDGRHGRRLSTGQGLRRGAWYHIAASYDGATGEAFIRQTPLATRGFDRVPTAEAGGHVSSPLLAAASLRIGAIGKPGPDCRRFATWLFDGKIEAPSLADRAMSAEELRVNAAVGATAPPAGNVLAHWDFAADIAGTRITDIGPRFLHGETFNAPKRAVLGARWDGSVHDWRQNPAHYAAIHFHSDDIYDAAWPDEFAWRVPDGQRSGIYALKLEAEGGAPFWVTFFLRPPRGKATARAAFLASTATYQVYANYRARMKPSDTADLAMGAMQFVDVTDMLALVEPALGSSTYDKHPDGSGVSHASRLRPLTNVRPTGRMWNIQIDYCLLDFLEAQGVACDVITDDDLHVEGLSLLENYAVVMSGCHPEYWSSQMLDGLEAYLQRGGRFMYLGGNGFYWRISYAPAHPGLIEIRRAEGGTRSWAETPGEHYHQSTGEYGGMWRRNGRPPNRLVGIGFVAQGFDYASYYLRRPESRDPRVAWMFEGIGEEKLGDFGCALGGAAGMEIDAASTALGTPAHALVVASSVGHSKVMNFVVEEIEAGFSGAYGGTWPAVRADITFFETPRGGAMFSTGSISYLGSLAHRGYDNNIARLTLNVVKRFLDPAPFAAPAR